MTKKDFLFHPQRVWINNPSTLQPHHKLHGKVGIGVLDRNTDHVYIYFTEGSVASMVIDPIHLDKKLNG